MVSDSGVSGRLAGKFAELRPYLDERRWRLYLGSEARAYAGEAGCEIAAAVAAVAGAAGVSRATVMAGTQELAEGPDLAPGRSRRPGAGRRKLEDKDPGLGAALKDVVEAATRGDPVAEITWCSLSLREIARQLAGRGYRCGKDAAARMLGENGYSLQGMSRTIEGSQHPDRDAQFGNINAMIRQFRAAGDPVVSVDGKKKEQLGPFYRAGRSWRPAGDPVRVRDHDFPDQELGKITPYGVFDIAANRGFVSVGTSHDTAAFAVNALRLWWRSEGAARYPGAGRLLVTCDAGGSNSSASRLWKHELAVLAQETGLEIWVCHFPPGTSKWNKIEHRLFCHITRTWRARPLMTSQDAVAGIAATTTYQGLKCTAVLDEALYPTGTEISGQRMTYLEKRILGRHDMHGEWNYTVLPAPRLGPDPAPAPGPAGPDPVMLAALAALAGITDPAALHAAIALPWQAAREQRLYLDRSHPRRKDSGSLPWRVPFEAIVTATVCHLRLGMPYRLLGELLGAHHSTISQAARRITPLLGQHGITAQHSRTPISALAQLQEHAAAQGIDLPPPPAPHPRTRSPACTCSNTRTSTSDTPETVN
jgi:hypothetical protein